MSVAEKIGFLPGFDRMPIENFAHSFFFFVFVTIGMMVLIGLVGESRLIPLSPRYQYLGFFPGDLFLSMSVSAAVQICIYLPEGNFWYNSRSFHIGALIATVVFAALMGKSEIRPGGHTLKEMLSWCGLYHTGVLYGLLGYVILTTALAAIAGSDWSNGMVRRWAMLSIVCALAYIACVVIDGKREFDSSTTYIENPKPIWRRSAA